MRGAEGEARAHLQGPGARGAALRVFRGLTPTSSLFKPNVRVVTGVNQNAQALLKRTQDSSSSNKCSPRVGCG